MKIIVDNNITKVYAGEGMELYKPSDDSFPTNVHSIAIAQNSSVWKYSERTETQSNDIELLTARNKSSTLLQPKIKLLITKIKYSLGIYERK